jgi:hypothetical protein
MSNNHCNTASAVTLVTTAETAVVTVTPFNTSSPGGEGVSISGSLNITTGTATTAVVIRVRQGSGVAGTVVGAALTYTIGAAVSATIPYDVLDTTALSATGQQYTVTAQQTAASANGTVNLATVNAESSSVVE